MRYCKVKVLKGDRWNIDGKIVDTKPGEEMEVPMTIAQQMLDAKQVEFVEHVANTVEEKADGVKIPALKGKPDTETKAVDPVKENKSEEGSEGNSNETPEENSDVGPAADQDVETWVVREANNEQRLAYGEKIGAAVKPSMNKADLISAIMDRVAELEADGDQAAA